MRAALKSQESFREDRDVGGFTSWRSKLMSITTDASSEKLILASVGAEVVTEHSRAGKCPDGSYSSRGPQMGAGRN